jgi:hypothetical protein
MGNERNEKVTVEKIDNRVIVRTEQTTVFPSLEEGRKQLEGVKAKEARIALVWSALSVPPAIHGLNSIIHGVESGNLPETSQGFFILGLSLFA